MIIPSLSTLFCSSEVLLFGELEQLLRDFVPFSCTLLGPELALSYDIILVRNYYSSLFQVLFLESE